MELRARFISSPVMTSFNSGDKKKERERDRERKRRKTVISFDGKEKRSRNNAKKMNKADKEAALNEKIAAIRAKNEALKKRHAEVQADKKEAEKISSSVTRPEGVNNDNMKHCESQVIGFHSSEEENVSLIEEGSRKGGSAHNSRSEERRKPASRSQRRPPLPSPLGNSRLKEAPPPDPSYRFLADRMRDGSQERNEEEDLHKSHKMEKRREFSLPFSQDENRSPYRKRGSPSKKTNGMSSNGGSQDSSWSDERKGLILREIRADSVTTKFISSDKISSKKHSKGENGIRYRSKRGGYAGEGESGEDYRDKIQRNPSSQPCKTEMSPNAAEWIPQAGSTDQASVQAWHSSISEWGGDWVQMEAPDWNLPVSTVSNWAEEIEKEQETNDSAGSSQNAWSGAPPLQYISLPPQYPQTQYNMQTVYPAHSSYVPMGQDYYHYQYQQTAQQQSSSHVISPNGVNNVTSSDAPTLTMPTTTRKSSSPHLRHPHNRHCNYNGNRSDSDKKRGKGEISRIPPRFQKPKPSDRSIKKPAKPAIKISVPRVSSLEPPSTCTRLTIFGTSNVADFLNERRLHSKLVQRFIPITKLKDLTEVISQIDPSKDRFIFIHGLGEDAREIAAKSQRTDLERAEDSDDLANEFCDVVEVILERIPYITVFVSTLLPRYDLPEGQGLSYPNNVRKVMNVQISTRLRSNPRVFIISNDSILEWLENEEKRNSLFASDGINLTQLGYEALLKHWKSEMSEILNSENISLPQEESHKTTDTLVSDVENMKVKDEETREPEKRSKITLEEFKEKENEEMMEKELPRE